MKCYHSGHKQLAISKGRRVHVELYLKYCTVGVFLCINITREYKALNDFLRFEFFSCKYVFDREKVNYIVEADTGRSALDRERNLILFSKSFV